MDASAYLRNHGWRGQGHSLDRTDRGIKKPLLISQKVDVLGVGLNKHKALSDQWWLRAFDQGLRSLGTDEETALSQIQKHGVNRGGLYANFVQGGQIEGSIGAGVLPTPDDSEDAVEKPTSEGEYIATAKMSTKRKRETEKERPAVKRARRKIERAEKVRAHVAEKREEEKQKAIEDGTYDSEAEAEKSAKRAHEREINNKANDFILEAQRRGIIPYGPNEIRRGLIPTGANATMISQPSEDLIAVLNNSGIDPANPVKVSGSLKAQKYARMKVQREIKRAAKAYLMGEPLPPLPATKEERKKLRKELKEKNKPTEEERARRKAEKLRAEAEKEATIAERDRRRTEKRERNREEKAVIDQILAERAAAGEQDGQLVKAKKVDVSAFDNEADEIKLGLSNKGTLRKIPGVGTVDRYPSKAEKKAKKQDAAAVKAEIGEEEMKARIAQNQAVKYGVDISKLEQYRERAKEKGLTLAEYVARRQQKKKELDSAKEREGLRKKWEGDSGEVIADDSAITNEKTAAAAAENEDASHSELGFVIDTAGDEKLEFKVTSTRAAYENENKPKPLEVMKDLREAASNPTTVPKKSKTSTPTNLAIKAITAIQEERPFTVVDAEGNPILQWTPGTHIPTDPRIWEGVEVSTLPRRIREARKSWMAIQRLERKKAEDPNYRKVQTKARAARKIEAREKFLHAILHASRDALKENGVWGGYASVLGRESVPLVHVESTEGKFSKYEISLARTVARRTQRDEKRALRASEGKGKGWKKRERAEKQARIEQGISGFVDRRRNG